MNLVTKLWPELNQTFLKSGFENLWTINKTQTTDLPIFGDYGQANFTYVKLSLIPCQNNTISLVTCKPQDEQFRFFSTNGLLFIANETYIDSNNPIQPLKW